MRARSLLFALGLALAAACLWLGATSFEQTCPAGLAEVEVELPAWQSCTVRAEGWKHLPWGERSYVALRSLDADPARHFTRERKSPTEEEARFDVVFPGRYEVFVARQGELGRPEERLCDAQVLEVTPDAPALADLKVEVP